MTKTEARALGGKAASAVRKKKALDAYDLNPNICLFCGSNILSKNGEPLGHTKRKKFCGSSCSAKFNNPKKTKKQKSPKPPRPKPCRKCGVLLGTVGVIVCDGCRIKPIRMVGDARYVLRGQQVKGTLFATRKNWQSARTEIRRRAAEVFELSGLSKPCATCGYETYTEICHRKAVSSFPPEATLAEINAAENLVALCPNHHWEFDNGLLVV